MKKQSSHYYFSLISKNVYSAGCPYKFAKHTELGSPKYKEGVTTVLDWVSEVSFHYMQKEQALKGELDTIIKEKEQFLRQTLLATPYKEGIIKGFTLTHDILHKLKGREEKE